MIISEEATDPLVRSTELVSEYRYLIGGGV